MTDEEQAREIVGPCEYWQTTAYCRQMTREASKCIRCRLVPDVAAALRAARVAGAKAMQDAAVKAITGHHTATQEIYRAASDPAVRELGRIRAETIAHCPRIIRRLDPEAVAGGGG